MAKHIPLAAILPILLVCAAILAVYFLLLQPDAVPPQGGAISLSIDRVPLVSGNTATLRAVSTCGEFDVSLDGAAFGGGGPLLSAPILLAEGSHAFFAQGNGCTSTLSFTVIARECEGNMTEECEMGGCPGQRACSGGIFSECSLPKKVCSPGEKIGCSTNGCSFGYMVCDRCGNGFGACGNGSQNKNSSCFGKPSCN